MAYDDDDEVFDNHHGWLPLHDELDDTDRDAEVLHVESVAVSTLLRRFVMLECETDNS